MTASGVWKLSPGFISQENQAGLMPISTREKPF